MSIGIFDSGIGGLSVYKKLKEKFPNTKFIYFADLYHFPYGEKKSNEILEYSRKISEFLIKNKVNKIIIACNTASSISLEFLNKEYDIKFHGMIKSITDYINKTNKNSISLVATKKTVQSKVYKYKLKDKLKYEISAPKLVEYVENINKTDSNDLIREYITEDMVEKTEIILGCTHFSFLKNDILRVYKNVKLLDPADYLVDDIKILENDTDNNDIFYTSNNLDYFKNQLKNILRKDNLDVRLYKWNS